jgi:hypothetical protein
LLERRQLVEVKLAAPLGVVVWQGERPCVLLPADVADADVGNHREMLEAVCRMAALSPIAWRDEKRLLTLIRTDSFVNSAPGGACPVPLVRGLPLLREPGLAQTTRSCELAADYLTRVQDQIGRFPLERDATSGIPTEGEDPCAQSAAAAALARFSATLAGDDAERKSRRERCIKACKTTLADLANMAFVPSAQPELAFVKEGGSSVGAPSPADTAAVLIAFCEYRRATDDRAWDPMIVRLANFLVTCQDESGAFRQPVAEEGAAQGAQVPALDIAAQAGGARALALSYGAVNRPEFLLGARKALDRLSADAEAMKTADAARGFVVALRDLSPHLPPGPYLPRVREALETLVERQLRVEDCPAPDLAGGTLRAFPQSVDETAADMEAFVSGWLVNRTYGKESNYFLDECLWQAALGAGRYVMQFQFLPENSYYLADADSALGGLRHFPGRNVATLQGTQHGLDALSLLSQAMTLRMQDKHDSKSQDH